MVGLPPAETKRDGHSAFKSMHFERSAQQESRADLLPSPVTASVGFASTMTMPLSEVKTTPSTLDTGASSGGCEASPPDSGTAMQNEEVDRTEVSGSSLHGDSMHSLL